MATEIITREDLEAFGEKLMSQMKALLSGGSTEGGEPRKWIKSYQVKNLQTLRDNGTIPFTKIGGILYYSFDDIQKILRGEVQSKRIRIAR
jgi:hypothetical protein